MPFIRITALWSGFPGGPGYSRFCFLGDGSGTDAQDAADSVRGLFAPIGSNLPSGTKIDVQRQYEIYDDTGVLTGYGTLGTAEATVSGADSGTYAGGSGAVIDWTTATVNGGRLVRGRTFIVPMGGSAFASDGSLANTVVTALTNAAQQLVGITPQHIIVSKKRDVIALAPVVSARVPDLAAVLRSRRD